MYDFHVMFRNNVMINTPLKKTTGEWELWEVQPFNAAVTLDIREKGYRSTFYAYLHDDNTGLSFHTRIEDVKELIEKAIIYKGVTPVLPWVFFDMPQKQGGKNYYVRLDPTYDMSKVYIPTSPLKSLVDKYETDVV